MEDAAAGRDDATEGGQWSRMPACTAAAASPGQRLMSAYWREEAEVPLAEDAAVVAARPRAGAGWTRITDVGPDVEAIPAHSWATQQDFSGHAQQHDVGPLLRVDKPAALLLPSHPPSAGSNTKTMDAEELGERVIHNCICACTHVHGRHAQRLHLTRERALCCYRECVHASPTAPPGV